MRQVEETFAGRPAAAPPQNLMGDFELFVFNVFKCLGPGDPGRPLGGQPGWVWKPELCPVWGAESTLQYPPGLGFFWITATVQPH